MELLGLVRVKLGEEPGERYLEYGPGRDGGLRAGGGAVGLKGGGWKIGLGEGQGKSEEAAVGGE